MAQDLDLGWVDPNLGALQRTERNFGSGLCRALATRWGIDVLLVRGAFLVLALCGAVGIAVYAWGTALTPGRSGVCPVDNYLPRMRTWPRPAQQLFVLCSSLVFTAILSPLTPLPWALGVLALFIALLRRRRRPKVSFSPAPAGPLSDQDLVELWREQMRSAAGSQLPLGDSQLPLVDLYAPQEPLPKPRSTAPPPRTSWFGGVLVLLAGGATCAVALLVLGANLLLALGASLIAAGFVGLVFAVAVRSRRLPSLVVSVLALSLVPVGWLATQASSRPAAVPSYHRTVLGTSAVIDLTQENLAGVESVEIRAVAAHVTIVVPGTATNLETDLDFSSEIRLKEPGATVEPFELPIHVEAAGSVVEIREAP